ncbi:MAG: hypothetical protein IM638_18110 [Bacteroidetes bacterium]|nr:hypothetical protein [Bacteroidota bacterium]
MKTPSDQLHQLIHSLDMNEKRYLSLYTGQNNEKSLVKSYQKLLTEIEAQKEYDERYLKNKLSLKSSDQFKRLKHYALETTLRSLENFHATGSPEIIILRKFIQAEILLQKKQIAALRRSIEQAMKLCLMYDKILYLPICLDWKFRLFFQEPQSKKNVSISKTEIDKTLDLIKRWLGIRRINVAAWRLLHQEHKPKNTELRQVYIWIEEVKKLVTNKEENFFMLREYTQTLTFCFHLLNDWENSLKYSLLFVKKIESDNAQLFNRSLEYITTLNNCFVAYINLERKGIEQYSQKAAVFYRKIPLKKRSVFVNDNYLILQTNYVILLLNKHNGEKAAIRCREIHKTIIQQQFKFNDSVLRLFFINYIVASIYIRKNKEALRFYNILLSYQNIFTPDNEILALIIYYELGEYDLLEHRVRSFRKQLKKSYPAGHFFNILATALTSSALQDSSRSVKAEAFTNLRNDLQKTNFYDGSKTISGVFDIEYWIDRHK